MQHLPPSSSGAVVTVRGERWRVARITPHDDCRVVALTGAGPANAGESFAVLHPFDDLVPSRTFEQPRARPFREVLHRARAALTARTGWTTPRTRTVPGVTLLPWQAAPLAAILAGATRVLVADDVGLGKTLEAGLIAAELVARGLAHRVLVLAPAALRAQWADELASKLGLAARVLDHASILRDVAALPPGSNPWAASPLVISSIDLVKRPEVSASLDGVPIDLLIVDEAHHAAPRTDRGALVHALAARALWVVLVTATPHSGDAAAFRYLTDAGAVGPAEAPMAVVRRAAAAVAARPRRREHRVRVRPTREERALGAALDAYLARLTASAGAGDAVHLLDAVLRRRCASSAAALSRTLARRRQLLAGDAGAAPEPRPLPLPWDETDGGDDVEPDRVVGAAPLPHRAEETASLDRLLTLAARAGRRPSKIAALTARLARVAEPVVVFSEYRDTVEDLRARLTAQWRVAVVHGGMPEPVRRAAVASFTHGDAAVLVATDTAGEGLNLQRRCRLLVHFEPAWSPVRVEQRAGRLDRVGQHRAVHAVHLVRDGSIEDYVIARRAGRANHAAAAAVPGPAREPAVAETTAREMPPDSRIPIHVRTPATRAILVFEVGVVDGMGSLVAGDVVAVQVDLARPPRRRAALARVLSALAGAPPVLAVVDAGTRAALDRERRRAAACADGWLARLDAIATGSSHVAPTAVQPALFDRRAARAADRRDAARAAAAAYWRARRDQVAAIDAADPARPRLVAAWTLP
ncbi:MAG: DEAD/DEAH box helicase [Acidobacteriota bacterium]